MILNQVRPQSVYFDPRNEQHVESFRVFLETGRWGDIKFVCEAPFVSVPEYVLRKFASFQLNATDVAVARIDLTQAAA